MGHGLEGLGQHLGGDGGAAKRSLPCRRPTAAVLPPRRAASSAWRRARTSWKLPLVPSTTGWTFSGAACLLSARGCGPSGLSTGLPLAVSCLPGSARGISTVCLAFSSLAFFLSSCNNRHLAQMSTSHRSGLLPSGTRDISLPSEAPEHDRELLCQLCGQG